MQTPLTKHPEGSIRELWSISFPLMISALASLLMIFVDRIFLAHYSTDTLNASVNAGTLAWAFMAGVGMITAMSEVFVAQYNGAKQYKKLGTPAWQMIWFGIFSFAFFIPMGIWVAPLVFQGDIYAHLEIEYFRWLMFFAPGYVIMMAFSGFFIGRGKTRILILLAIVANVINVLLDSALIFGVPGWIPEMGITGAAIATSFGYLFETAVLAFLFLKKENRELFGTGDWRIQWSEMSKCCKVGVPQGIYCALEVLGFAVFYWMMTALGPKHITVSSICQSFAILLSFFCDGLSRGASSVAGNFMGSRRYDLVHKSLRSGSIILLFFSVAISFVLLIDSTDLVKLLFLNNPDAELIESLHVCMQLVFVYMVFDGFRWLLSGLLAAAGDTVFLLMAGTFSVWLFLLAPVYFIVVKQNLPVEYAWGIMAFYAVFFLAVYWMRFKQGSWQRINLLKEEKNDLS